MGFFNYRVRDEDGKIKEGGIEATNVKKATEVLEKQGYLIVSLEKIVKKSFTEKVTDLLTRVSIKEIALLSEQMATMFEAGVPIVETLRILTKQTVNKKLRKILEEVANDVESGVKLSYALGQYPKVFSQFYVGMVRSGEAAGQVSRNLNFLAAQMKKIHELRSEIKGAMMYPAFIVAGVVGVMLLAVFYVIPNLLSVLTETGDVELPLSTRIVMAITNFATGYWYILLAIMLLLAIGGYSYLKTENGRKNFDYVLLKTPLFGKMIQKYYLSQFASNLSSLISGGVSIVEAFQMVGDMMPNKVYQGIFLETAEKIRGGQRINSVMAKKLVIPPMLTNMLAVGEETGKVDKVLDKLADYYQREVDTQVKGMVSLIEPVLMVGLGLAVGVLVSAVLMPMYNMASSF